MPPPAAPRAQTPRRRPCASLQVLVAAAVARGAAANANFLAMIPNGIRVSEESSGGGWHALGHTRPLPDPKLPHVPFERNDFGRDFFEAGHRWTRSLCMKDSDGDGLSNGEELGDPTCTWQIGQTPGRSHDLTHPGVADNPRHRGASAKNGRLTILSSTRSHRNLSAAPPPTLQPPAFRVSGAGFVPSNGVYTLVTEHAQLYSWGKRGGWPYLWRHLKEDCSLWCERLPGEKCEWGISCYGDHVYQGGGVQPFPLRPERVRGGAQDYERGRPPAPQLEALQDGHEVPEPPELQTDGPLGDMSDIVYYTGVYFPPAVILASAMLALYCPWLPPVRWRLVYTLWLWLWWGETSGAHRYFSHRAFKAGFWTKNALALAAGMNIQDNPISWARVHRVHHRVCDEELDFHSPEGRGFWHAHAGWMHTPKIHAPFGGYDDRVADLVNDPDLWLTPYYTGTNMTIAYVLISAAVATCVVVSRRDYRRSAWQPPAMAVYFLGIYAMLPMYTMWNLSMMINSVVHMWGVQPFVDGNTPHLDHCRAKNLALTFPFQQGENWHNNHHAAPGSASTWVYWYQVDLVYVTIRVLEVLGLVWDVRVEPAAAPRAAYEEGPLEAATMMAWVCILAVVALRLFPSRALGSVAIGEDKNKSS